VAVQYSIRRGVSDDFLDVIRLFDAGVLETDASRVKDQLAGRDGFVRIASVDETPIGAIAVAKTPPESVDISDEFDEIRHITAIAVRKTRQNRGIGRALVTAAASVVAPRALSAFFEKGLQPFYLACGFEIHERDDHFIGLRKPSPTV